MPVIAIITIVSFLTVHPPWVIETKADKKTMTTMVFPVSPPPPPSLPLHQAYYTDYTIYEVGKGDRRTAISPLGLVAPYFISLVHYYGTTFFILPPPVFDETRWAETDGVTRVYSIISTLISYSGLKSNRTVLYFNFEYSPVRSACIAWK